MKPGDYGHQRVVNNQTPPVHREPPGAPPTSSKPKVRRVRIIATLEDGTEVNAELSVIPTPLELVDVVARTAAEKLAWTLGVTLWSAE